MAAGKSAEPAEDSRVPIDRGWAWVIVAGHFCNVFFMVGIAKSFGILLIEFKNFFGVSMALTSMVISTASIVYAFMAPISLMLGERFTCRKVVMLGGLLGTIGIAISSLMPSIDFIIVFFGITFGMGNATLYGNGLIIISQYFKKRRSLANGLALSGASVGQFALPPLIQYLIETYDVSGCLLILGGMYFHITVCGALFRPISSYKRRRRKTQQEPLLSPSEQEATNHTATSANGDVHVSVDTDLILQDQKGWDEDRELRAIMGSTGSIYLTSLEDITLYEQKSAKHPLQEEPQQDATTKKKKKKCSFPKLIDFCVLRKPMVAFYAVIGFLIFFGYFNFVLILPDHVVSKGVTRYWKAMLVSIVGIGDLAGRLIFGFLGDLKKIKRYQMKGVVCILLGINLIVFSFADNFYWMAVHAALYGFLGGGYVCQFAVVLIDIVGMELMARALGVMLLIQGVGSAGGQPLLGMIADRTGSYTLAMYLCGTTIIVGAVLLLCYPLVKQWVDRKTGQQSTPS